jgi:hypothetical protein
LNALVRLRKLVPPEEWQPLESSLAEVAKILGEARSGVQPGDDS